MILVNQLVAVCGRKFRKGLLATGIPSLVNDLLKRVNVHDFAFSGSTISRHILEPGLTNDALLYCRAVVGQSLFRSSSRILFHSSLKRPS